MQKVALLSNDTLSSGSITSFDELLSVVSRYEYPLDGAQRGIFITVTSALEAHEFGCIIVGTDTADVVNIQQQVQARIAEFSQAKA